MYRIDFSNNFIRYLLNLKMFVDDLLCVRDVIFETESDIVIWIKE